MPDTSIEIIKSPTSWQHLKELAATRFGDMVKAVVDVERRVMAIGGELHADEEALLIQQGSKQENLWGINIYIDQALPQAIEFDSMINVRPSQENRSREVQAAAVRQKIIEIVSALVVS